MYFIYHEHHINICNNEKIINYSVHSLSNKEIEDELDKLRDELDKMKDK